MLRFNLRVLAVIRGAGEHMLDSNTMHTYLFNQLVCQPELADAPVIINGFGDGSAYPRSTP